MTINEVLDRFKVAGCKCPEGWDWITWNTDSQISHIFPDDPLRYLAKIELAGDFAKTANAVWVVICGKKILLDGYTPEVWFARQAEQAEEQAKRQPPQRPFITEIDLIGVTSFQDLVHRMVKAREMDASEYDEYEHTGSPYSDAVLAQAVLYLALSMREGKLLEQARTLIQTYQSVPQRPNPELARRLAMEQVRLHQKAL